jgi:TPR repeat protein
MKSFAPFFGLLFCTTLFAAKDGDLAKPELLSTTTGGGAEARQWDNLDALKKAAAAGDPAANHELGERMLAGNQVAADISQALLLLERAAAAGHGEAAFRLGKLHADGERVPADLGKAFVYYEKAARKNVAEAQHNLGAMYASARGVKRDYAEGLAWLILAAKNGAAPEGERQLREHLLKGKRAATIAAAEKRAVTLTEEIASGVKSPTNEEGESALARPALPLPPISETPRSRPASEAKPGLMDMPAPPKIAPPPLNPARPIVSPPSKPMSAK